MGDGAGDGAALAAAAALTRAGQWAAALCALALSLGIVWGAGFEAFNRWARQAPPLPATADGIVVLTGGAERVEAGLRLLAEGRAPMLLVSGVGRGTDLWELARRAPLSPEQVSQITLGRTATTTASNARETSEWARAHRLGSLMVVTAGYHMPRALIEIGRTLPGVALHPAPVQSPALRGEMEFATMRLLAGEFDKYLAVRLGLTRLGLTRVGLAP